MLNNSVNCSFEFQEKLLPPMYGVEFCVGFLGNVFALVLLLTKERQNWHTGVVFSCNLIISDLLYVLTLPLLITYYSNNKNWTFGVAACKIERFLFTCNLYVSIFFILCISVNRYIAIVHPLFTHSYVRPKHAKITSVLVWVIVAIISSPVLKYASTEPIETNNITLCVSAIKGAEIELSHFNYRLSLTVLGFLIPLVLTFASYIGVIRVVFKSTTITPQEKRKVALLVGSVCTLYALSFIPYHILQTYHYSLKKRTCLQYDAYQISKGFATLNMCIHPLLYMAVFDSIRVVCCGKSSETRSDTCSERI
ncbi:P2Y purinoceptor 11-like [Chanos chanos]|uniref:P2Y purinoceptor 11-like n=1 Tax=Chanos chanos TaxID=29144 RepID=A0A6J2VQ58_CHACN|nr:P2Y purinoceptor 11-like [Chanos chanos]